MMHFDVVTLFPEMFDALTGCGITRRARENGALRAVCWNPRDFSSNSYRRVDDRPYGGGPGDGDDGRTAGEGATRSAAAASAAAA